MKCYRYSRVFAELYRALRDKSSWLLLEVVETYEVDASNGDLSPERIRGFMHGLYAAGVLSAEDYDDCDVALCKVEGL